MIFIMKNWLGLVFGNVKLPSFLEQLLPVLYTFGEKISSFLILGFFSTHKDFRYRLYYLYIRQNIYESTRLVINSLVTFFRCTVVVRFQLPIIFQLKTIISTHKCETNVLSSVPGKLSRRGTLFERTIHKIIVLYFMSIAKN